MGGFAAKQRRRLERQSLQPTTPSDDDYGKYNKSSPHSKNPLIRKGTNGGKINQQQRSDGTKSRSSIAQHDARRSVSTNIVSTSKKSKIQKPKHLKRKLEKISSNSDQEKEQILKQLNEFERAKKENQGQEKRQQDRHGQNISNKRSKGNEDGKRNVLRSNERTISGKSQHRNLEVISKVINSLGDRTENESSIKSTAVQESIINPVQSVDTTNDEMKSKAADLASQNGNITISDKGKNTHDEEDDNDDDMLESAGMVRQRGKRLRRRGLLSRKEKNGNDIDNSTKVSTGIDDQEKERLPCVDDEKPSQTVNLDSTNAQNELEHQMQQERVRYCIGRKPVTDFKIGQRCNGTVVYSKPYGIFIDVGCHSDAFCHVSQLSDQFIDNPVTSFPAGFKIENHRIRVIDIDRKKKQITVTLKSSKINDEGEQNVRSNIVVHSAKGENLPLSDTTTSTSIPSISSCVSHESSSGTIVSFGNDIDSSCNRKEKDTTKVMSDAEKLKRIRKLERRAQRRADRSNERDH